MAPFLLTHICFCQKRLNRSWHGCVKEQGREGYEGIVQGEKALGHLEPEAGSDGAGPREPYGEGSFAVPYLPGENGDEEEGA